MRKGQRGRVGRTVIAATKNLLSQSWAIQVAGARSLSELLAGDPAAALKRWTRVLSRLQQSKDELSPTFLSLFQIGDKLQRDAIGQASAWLRDPRQAAGLAHRWIDQIEEGLQILGRGAGGVAGEETVNKSRVFLLVLTVGKSLGIPQQGLFPLDQFVDRAYGLDDFSALWAVEGLGHDYAESRWPAESLPRQLLSEEEQPQLPAASLLMLHAGIGLSFAQRELRDLTEDNSTEAIESAVATVVELCRANSRAGFAGAALESLGLQAYAFHSQAMALRVGEAVAAVAPEAVGFYWHGVGRALYFDIPVAFLPCSGWSGFERARALAPDEAAMLGMWAGLAWAWTLVNQRNPEILASLLVSPHGEQLAENSAFANGVASSTLMRQVTTPGAEFVRPFFDYLPEEETAATRWRELVGEPCERAIRECLPQLEKERRLDELFCYRQKLC